MKLSAACAFVVGTVALDIGSTIGTTGAAPGETYRDNWAVSAVEMKSAKKTKVHSHEAAGATPTTTTTTSWLFVQAGTTCSLAQHANGGYTLRATIGNETVALSERPERRAETISTTVFVDKFADLFASSNPNAAITFAGDDDEEQTSALSSSNNGPLIAVLSQPMIVRTGVLENDSNDVVIEVDIEQMGSQGDVVSITQFLDQSGSCSIFIDSFSLAACEKVYSLITCLAAMS